MAGATAGSGRVRCRRRGGSKIAAGAPGVGTRAGTPARILPRIGLSGGGHGAKHALATRECRLRRDAGAGNSVSRVVRADAGKTGLASVGVILVAARGNPSTPPVRGRRRA